MKIVSSDGERSRALASLYQEHARTVRRCLAHFGASPAEVDDLCHEVFLIADRRLPELPPDEERGRAPWLREVCRRVAFAQSRRARRHRGELVSAVEAAASDADRPDLGLERQEEGELVRRAFERLGDRAQRLMAWYFVEDLTVNEVARLEACDRKTARKHIALALRHLVRGFSLG